MTRSLRAFTCGLLLALALPLSAAAQERLCDTQFEDCRTPLLNLIRQETQGIDVAFWFMEDQRYVTELIKRHQAGVPVRILVDERANTSKRLNADMLKLLADAGIPMRDKFGGGDILHFKMMLFHGQNVVQFSKANYTDLSFVPAVPNSNYFDEVIFFTNDDNLTDSFRRRFDDLWIDMTAYEDYRNITSPPARRYPWLDASAIHPSMNFPPLQDFGARAASRYDRETRGIDAHVYRVSDGRHTDKMINAVARGVPVRLITEPEEYRNASKLWHSKHMDRMFVAGVQIKNRRHAGLMHQGSVVLRGLGEVIFGSSNWTTTSAIYQDEHNYFYNPGLNNPGFFDYFANQFDRKWTDTTNYAPFQPLASDSCGSFAGCGAKLPEYTSPGNFTTGHSSSLTLTWDGGPWAHLYDIYFGTSPNPPLVAGNVEVGSPNEGQLETFGVGGLLPGTTYYWRIVAKTWAAADPRYAYLARTGPTWNFTTAGGTPPPSGSVPYGGTPAAVPGTIQAENFDEGGQTVAWSDTTTGNSIGAYRTNTDVDIETTTGGGFDVAKVKAGEWVKYTVNVSTTATYALETRVANVGTGARFRVEVDGVNVTGSIPVPDTGGWQAWRTLPPVNISLTAGQRIIRVVFEVTASGGGVGNFDWFRLSIGSAPPPPPPPSGSTPYGGSPPPVPGTLQAENFDEGGPGVAWNDTTTGNSFNLYRLNTDVDIEQTTDTGGGFNLGKVKAGEWVKYTVNVSTSGTYTLDTRVANVGTGARFHVEVDGANVSGTINVPNTGAWQTWQTISTPNIKLNAGQHVIRVVFDVVGSGGGVGNFNWFRFR